MRKRIAIFLLFGVCALVSAQYKIGDFVYRMRSGLNENEIEITGYTGPGGSIVIPAYIDGKPVTGIGSNAFANKRLTQVIFPITLKSIGGDWHTGAFYGNNLTTIVIPFAVTSIGDIAFNNNNLKNVVIGSGVKEIYPGAFAGNPYLEYIEIPSNVNFPGLGDAFGDKGFSYIYRQHGKQGGPFIKTGTDEKGYQIWQSSVPKVFLDHRPQSLSLRSSSPAASPSAGGVASGSAPGSYALPRVSSSGGSASAPGPSGGTSAMPYSPPPSAPPPAASGNSAGSGSNMEEQLLKAGINLLGNLIGKAIQSGKSSSQSSPTITIAPAPSISIAPPQNSGPSNAELSTNANQRGNNYFSQGNYDSAIIEYNEAIRLNPSSVLYSNRGHAYHQKGDIDNAITNYETALRMDPNNSYAKPLLETARARKSANDMNQSGISFFNQGNYDSAILEFNEAIRLSPSSIFYSNRGHAYHQKGDIDNAITNYETALRMDPNNSHAKSLLETARARKSANELAMEHYQRGANYCESEDWNNAILEFTEAIRIDPNYFDALFYRATVSIKMGDYNTAISDYTRAIEIKPNYSFLYFERARTYRLIGDTARAEADMAKSLE